MQIKREDNLRQGAGFICVSAAVVIFGLLVGGEAGDVTITAGASLGILSLALIAAELLRTR